LGARLEFIEQEVKLVNLFLGEGTIIDHMQAFQINLACESTENENRKSPVGSNPAIQLAGKALSQMVGDIIEIRPMNQDAIRIDRQLNAPKREDKARAKEALKRPLNPPSRRMRIRGAFLPILFTSSVR
jgi:hypothetical protein